MSVQLGIMFVLLLLVGERKDADVAELEAAAVAAEADVSAFVEHSGMVAVVNGVGVGAAVGGDIVALACFADVAVHNYLSVDCDGDVVTYDLDLLIFPFSEGLVDDPLGRDDTVDGAWTWYALRFA